jgi:hypothetical protein
MFPQNCSILNPQADRIRRRQEEAVKVKVAAPLLPALDPFLVFSDLLEIEAVSFASITFPLH